MCACVGSLLFAAKSSAGVELEVDDVAVLHDIGLTLLPIAAGRLRRVTGSIYWGQTVRGATEDAAQSALALSANRNRRPTKPADTPLKTIANAFQLFQGAYALANHRSFVYRGALRRLVRVPRKSFTPGLQIGEGSIGFRPKWLVDGGRPLISRTVPTAVP